MRSERLGHQRLQARETTGGYANASNNFDVHYYRCEWNVDPAINFINGKVTSIFTMTATGNSITYDLDNILSVDSVLYHDTKISFQQDTNKTISLTFPANLASNQTDSVSIFYRGTPTKTGFGSFTQTTHAGIPVIWTLSEPYGGRDWWPCKNGLSDKADSIDVFLTHPATYTGTSNGVLQQSVPNGSNLTDWYKHRYPIATYLVAFEVTNFVVLSDTVQVASSVLPLIMIHDRVGPRLTHTLGATRRAPPRPPRHRAQACAGGGDGAPHESDESSTLASDRERGSRGTRHVVSASLSTTLVGRDLAVRASRHAAQVLGRRHTGVGVRDGEGRRRC